MPTRLEKLRARRDDPTVTRKAVSEAYASLQEDDNVKYVVGAMQPIDPASTEKSFEEGTRVADQIKNSYPENSNNRPQFAFQGSVTSDTHIKSHSDIDLLVIEPKFHYVQKPLEATSPYQGDPIFDLTSLRGQCAETLPAAFSKAEVNTKPGKAIKLSGGSLSRKVDVVVAAWLNTEAYVASGHDIVQRGISVFDSASNTTIKNFPFLHNLRIHDKDGEVGGNLRRVIRLLKTINADAEKELGISSYDIAALAYRMPDASLKIGDVAPLLLLEAARTWLEKVAGDSQLRATLKVPNDTRDIFCSDGATIAGLEALSAEVTKLANEIKGVVAKKYRVLSEHRIELSGVQPFPARYPSFERSRLVF